MEAIKIIFIDEVSMVGAGMLSFIHKRLQELTMSSKPFGGICIIACGDLFQLKPVCDSHIFQERKDGYGPLASKLWKDNFQMCELKQIMRQKNRKQQSSSIGCEKML